MQKKKFTLKKLNRLKSKKSFQIVYVKGRTVVDAMSVFYILPDQGEDIKIGLAVGKKLTKADYKTFERVFLRLAKRAALLQ